jgi:quinol monooxygenase YgiN
MEDKMIHVVAALRVKEGRLEEFLEMFRKLAPIVRQEKGCHQYLVTVDVEDTGVPSQVLRKNEITFVEKWEGVEAMEAHMQTPHMKAQMAQEGDIVEEMVFLKILKEV